MAMIWRNRVINRPYTCFECEQTFPGGMVWYVGRESEVLNEVVSLRCPECFQKIQNAPPTPPTPGEQRILDKLHEMLEVLKGMNPLARCDTCAFWFEGECRLVENEYKQTMPDDACRACEQRPKGDEE